MNALELMNVSKHAGSLAVLSDVSFVVPEGAFYVLSGRSGAGKSSLLSVAGGLDADYAGDVRVFGESWRAKSERARAALRNQTVGFVFQIPRLFANLSVWQNLTAPAWIGSKRVDSAWGERLLDRVGLTHKRQAPVAGLSGGERQRLTVARALLNRPRLLLCDEPTGNLDKQTGDEVLALLTGLVAEQKLTLFVVTHDPSITAKADKVITISAGRLT